MKFLPISKLLLKVVFGVKIKLKNCTLHEVPKPTSYVALSGATHEPGICTKVSIIIPRNVIVGYLTPDSDLDLAPDPNQFGALPPVRYINL